MRNRCVKAIYAYVLTLISIDNDHICCATCASSHPSCATRRDDDMYPAFRRLPSPSSQLYMKVTFDPLGNLSSSEAP